MAGKKAPKSEYLLFKGKPLVRCGNALYYGDMKDKYVIAMQIVDTEKKEQLDMATKVIIQLQATDGSGRAPVKTIKTSEKMGLYDAIDIGQIWLQRALAE
ncbi:MAG: hypothetical protein ACOX7F_03170 [Eubacteriales bacterium]